MAERRKFSAAFKRQVVEELLSGVTTLAQLSRRLDVSSGLIVHWKKRYEEGVWLRDLPGRRKNFSRVLRSLSRWWVDSPWRTIF